MELALVSRGPSWSSSPAGQMAYLLAAVFPGSWEEVGEQVLETFEAALGNVLEMVGEQALETFEAALGNALEVGEQALETFEVALGNALEAVAAVVETVLEMVGMPPCLLPHRNRRPEHYACLVIVLLDLGWGRPC